MFVKILGTIDFLVAFVFLLLLFGAKLSTPFILLVAFVIFLKGLFIIFGDFLSLVDLAAALILIFSIFLSLPSVFLWVPLLVLLLKGVISFL